MNKLSRIIMAAFVLAVVPGMAAAAGTTDADLSVDVLQPEEGEEVTVQDLSSSLSTEVEVANDNSENSSTGDLVLNLTDDDGNHETYDVEEDYELDADTTETFDYTVSDFGDLEAGDSEDGEEWTVTAEWTDTDEEYTVSDENTFTLVQTDTIGVMMDAVKLLLILAVVGGVLKMFK